MVGTDPQIVARERRWGGLAQGIRILANAPGLTCPAQIGSCRILDENDGGGLSDIENEGGSVLEGREARWKNCDAHASPPLGLKLRVPSPFRIWLDLFGQQPRVNHRQQIALLPAVKALGRM